MEVLATPRTREQGLGETIQNVTSCIVNVNDEFVLSSLAAALVTLLILSFAQKRRRLWPRLCWGLPSIVVPIDLIHSSPHRLAYVLGFGAISGEILQLFSNGGVLRMVADTTWGFSLSAIIALFSQSLLYFPVFATIDSTIPILGYIIGFFYSIVLFSRTILNSIVTFTRCFTIFTTGASTINVVVGAFSVLPIIICQLFLLIWYVWRFCKEVNRLAKRKEPLCKALFRREDSNYYAIRVKWLLMKYQMKTEGKCVKTVNRLLKFLYKYDPTILYPLRFLASVVVMLTTTFLLTLITTTALVDRIVPLRDNITRLEGPISQLAERIDDRLEFFNITNVNISSFILNTFSILKDSTSGLAVILPTGPVFAFVWNFLLLAHMITQVHKHLRLLGQGDFSFLPTKLPSPSYRLVAAVRYSGYQIGYFVWAWVIILLLVWLVGVVGLALYFLLKFFLEQTLYVIATLATPIIYSVLLYYAQLVLCKLFFVGDTNNKHTVITNIRVFHWFTYIMFFQNVVVGIISALLRIFYSIGFGLLLLFRLDRVVLMRGFENFDGGHKTYIGFLYLEHTLNNPVLNVFVSLLLEVAEERKKSDGDEGSGTVAHGERGEKEWRKKSDGDEGSGTAAHGEQGEKEWRKKSDGDEGSGTVTHGEQGEKKEEETKTRDLRLVGTTEEQEEGGESRPVETQRTGPRVSRQAANRWLVAYTLLRNESIRTLTASRLRENPPKPKEKEKHENKSKSKEEQDDTEEGGGAKGEEVGVTRVIIETPEPSEPSGASFSDQQGSRNETSSMEDTEL